MTSLTSPARPPAAGLSPRQWALLLVLAANMLVDALEVSVVVVALPAIGTDLNLGPASAQWTLTGFATGFGGLMLFGGRVVERYGRRRVYLAALLVFAAASLLAGAAQGPELLLATRLVKGFCAALTAPTGLAIIGATFPEGPARGRAVSVYSLFGVGGFTLGLLLSGALTDVNWRWAMAFPAPLVLLLFLVARPLVPADPPGRAAPARLGTTAALTLTGGLLALVYALAHGTRDGWDGVRVMGGALVGAALLAVFRRAERASPQPLVPAGAATRPAMARSALGAAAMNGSYLGLLLVLTFQFQTRWGWSPWHAALALLPAALPPAATALLSGRMVARFGAPRLIAAGAAVTFLGHALYLGHGVPTSYARDVLPTLLCVAAGFVLAFTALNMQATSGVPDAGRGTAVGVYQTAVQLGAVLVPATAAALLPDPGAPASAAAGRPALVLVTAVGALGLLTALTGLRPRTGRAARPDRKDLR
ncbi:MFS transporter [Streptomyces xanthochromogenes]|uniref:MFS transporter n=1 Tax=Streptomyces xanthochromogenes TaxID=67384 RepID=UPI00342E5437